MSDALRSAILGQEEASKVLAQVRTGHALPDKLHVTLQQIRSLGDGEMLREFTRSIQKQLEADGRERRG